MLIAIGAIGSAAGFGSLDTVINAYVQQFGATPHELVTTPGLVHNVQIDWVLSANSQFIQACDLTFDRIVPAGTKVVCHLSGHDTNPFDNIVTPVNGVPTPGPFVGTGSITTTAPLRSVTVPVTCNPNATPCDVQDIEDVKVILVGKDTTRVLLTEGPFGSEVCRDGLDNDFDGETDEDDTGCQD